SGMNKQIWPAPEKDMAAARTIPPRGLSEGGFALMPAKDGDKSSTPPLSTTVRASSRRAQLAKSDNPQRMPLVQLESQWHDRFAQDIQAKLAKEGKSKNTTAHPAPVGGKGGADAKKTQPDVAFAREYPFSYKKHGGTPVAPATLLWHPNLFAADGSASVSFDLSGSGATYRIILFGNTPSGRLGSFQGKLQAK